MWCVALYWLETSDIVVTLLSMSEATTGLWFLGLTLSGHWILYQKEMVFQWENSDQLCDTTETQFFAQSPTPLLGHIFSGFPAISSPCAQKCQVFPVSWRLKCGVHWGKAAALPKIPSRWPIHHILPGAPSHHCSQFLCCAQLCLPGDIQDQCRIAKHYVKPTIAPSFFPDTANKVNSLHNLPSET